MLNGAGFNIFLQDKTSESFYGRPEGPVNPKKVFKGETSTDDPKRFGATNSVHGGELDPVHLQFSACHDSSTEGCNGTAQVGVPRATTADAGG